jgi:cytochrome b561
MRDAVTCIWKNALESRHPPILNKYPSSAVINIHLPHLLLTTCLIVLRSIVYADENASAHILKTLLSPLMPQMLNPLVASNVAAISHSNPPKSLELG